MVCLYSNILGICYFFTKLRIRYSMNQIYFNFALNVSNLFIFLFVYQLLFVNQQIRLNNYLNDDFKLKYFYFYQIIQALLY